MESGVRTLDRPALWQQVGGAELNAGRCRRAEIAERQQGNDGATGSIVGERREQVGRECCFEGRGHGCGSCRRQARWRNVRPKGRVEPAQGRADLRQELRDEVLQLIPIDTRRKEQSPVDDALIAGFHAVNLLDAQLIIPQSENGDALKIECRSSYDWSERCFDAGQIDWWSYRKVQKVLAEICRLKRPAVGHAQRLGRRQRVHRGHAGRDPPAVKRAAIPASGGDAIQSLRDPIFDLPED